MSKQNPRLKNRAVQKTTLTQVFWLGLAGTAIMSLSIYFAIFLSTVNPELSSAGVSYELLHDNLNNGQLIAAYTFDHGDPLKSDIGVTATQINQSARCLPGGKNGSMGIGSVDKNGDIGLVLTNSEELNRDGIDISLDYVRSDKVCSFYSRGDNFNFGIKKGRVSIKMELEDGRGRSYVVEEESKYVIPMDDLFRNYRFILDPVKGEAEIFVNKIPVWKYRTGIDQKLKWDKENNAVMGKGITGGGSSRAVVDNFFIRATDEKNPLPLELFSFTAKTLEGNVQLAWITGEESNIDHYIVERSEDAKDFQIIGMVAANSAALEFNNYKFEDFNPSYGLVFYRIRIKELYKQSTGTANEELSFPTIAYSYKKESQDSDPTMVNSFDQVKK